MANGYELHMQSDGLIVARPRRARSIGISPRAALMFIAGFLVFKGLLIAALGPVTYEERLAGLSQGSTLEQAGAWVMQIDLVSREVASWITPYLS